MHTRRPWLLAAALALPIPLALGCDDDEGGGPSEEAVLVEAHVTSTNARIVILDDGSPVSGATVEVNGIAATPGAASEYLVSFPSPLNDGDAVALSITADGAEVTGTGTFPEGPVTTAPADGATFGTTQQVPVSWTATAHPLRWAVVAEGSTTETFDVPGGGSLRTFTIPTGELPDGAWTIRVLAFSEGDLDGDLEEDSFLLMVASAPADPVITLGPPPM